MLYKFELFGLLLPVMACFWRKFRYCVRHELGSVMASVKGIYL